MNDDTSTPSSKNGIASRKMLINIVLNVCMPFPEEDNKSDTIVGWKAKTRTVPKISRNEACTFHESGNTDVFKFVILTKL